MEQLSKIEELKANFKEYTYKNIVDFWNNFYNIEPIKQKFKK